MTYFSPLHIIPAIDEENISQLDDASLLRLRKKLIAEFNLTGCNTIEINGYHYTKDDVIKAIDKLTGNADLPLHSFIYCNKALLHFLEHESSPLPLAVIKTLQIPEELKGKVYTLLTEKIAAEIRKCIYTKNFVDAQSYIFLLKQLPENFLEDCYELIFKSLQFIVNSLKNFEENIQQLHLNDVEYLKRGEFALFLNSLPEEFHELRNSLTAAFINFLVAYQKTKNHDKDFVYLSSCTLMQVEHIDVELHDLIRRNHLVFKGGKTTSSGGGGYSFNLAYIAVIFTIFIVRACLHTPANNSFENIRYTNYPNLNHFNINKDSLPLPVTIISNTPATNTSLIKYRRETLLRDSMDYGRNTPKLYDSLRPANGINPFSQLFTDTSALASCMSSCIIENTSGYDLVLFNYHSNYSKAVYIRNGKSVDIDLCDSSYLCFYTGKNWKTKKVLNASSSSDTENEGSFTEYDPYSLQLFSKIFQYKPGYLHKVERYLHFSVNFLNPFRSPKSHILHEITER